MLQVLYSFCGPLLDSLQEILVFLVLGSPELDTILQVRPNQGRVEGEDHLPWPVGQAPFKAPQDPTGLLGQLGTLLAHCQPAIHQDPQVLLHRAPLQQVMPLYWYLWLFLLRSKTLLLLLLNIIWFILLCSPACPGLAEWQHRLQVCQQLLPACIIGVLAEGGHYPLIKVVNEDRTRTRPDPAPTHGEHH